MNWTFLRSRLALGMGGAGGAARGGAGGGAGTHSANPVAAAMDLQAQHGFLGLALSPITDAVAKKLKELPVDDAFASGKVLANGRFVHDMYLFEVKKPSESKGEWDLYKLVAKVPPEEVLHPLNDKCKFPVG